MEKRHRMTERELALRNKKSELEFALTFMRGQCLRARVDNDPNLRLYEVAVECIEKQYIRVIKELV